MKKLGLCILGNLSIIGCGTMENSIPLLASWAAIEVKVSGVNEIDRATADKGLRNKLRLKRYAVNILFLRVIHLGIHQLL